MSPEQIQGHEIDQRSDLFAFGIILYEMLTGQHPWPRQSAVDTLHAILHDDPPAIHVASLMQYGLGGRRAKASPQESRGAVSAWPKLFWKLSAAVRRPRGSSATSVASPKPLTSIAVLPFVFLSEVDEAQRTFAGLCGRFDYHARQPGGRCCPADIGDPELRPRYGTCPGLPRSRGRATSCRGMSRTWERAGASRCSSSMR